MAFYLASKNIFVLCLVSCVLINFVYSAVLVVRSRPTPQDINCDDTPLKEESDAEWFLIREFSNLEAGRYGNIDTTHRECRAACLQLRGCTGYDWYPIGWNNTKCWIGNNCPVTVSPDKDNQRYIPRKTIKKCYPGLQVDEYDRETPNYRVKRDARKHQGENNKSKNLEKNSGDVNDVKVPTDPHENRSNRKHPGTPGKHFSQNSGFFYGNKKEDKQPAEESLLPILPNQSNGKFPSGRHDISFNGRKDSTGTKNQSYQVKIPGRLGPHGKFDNHKRHPGGPTDGKPNYRNNPTDAKNESQNPEIHIAPVSEKTIDVQV